jgi:hypothetical protein
MRRVTLFISRFTIGLLIVSICTFTWFIVRVSPGVLDTDITGVTIAWSSVVPVRFSGYNFSCDKDGGNSLTQCQGVIENNLLELAVTYTDRSNSNLDSSTIGCKAVYAGKPLTCEAVFEFQGQKAPFPTHVFIYSDLGINQQRILQLRQENWITNISEDDWIRLANLAALTIGAITTMWLWQHIGRKANPFGNPLLRQYQLINSNISKKIFFCLVGGLTTVIFSWVFFFLSLLGLWYID